MKVPSMTMKLWQIPGLLTVLLLLLAGPPVQAQPAPLAGLDDYVNKSLEDWSVPGLAIAVVKDDRVVLAKGYGVRELGKPEPVDERTLFAIGSSSKAFTAAAIGMLVDDKKIAWDDAATKHLPGFQLFDPYATREATVRDLLSHRVGLDRGDQLWYATAFERDEVVRRIRYLKPASSMRSRFGYQNIMFLAAGQIVKAVAGKEWDDVVRERIFEPLGMKDTGTSIRALSRSRAVATPHSKFDDKVVPIPYRNVDNIAPAGSINSNVVDMAQWVRLHLGSGTYDGKRLLSDAVVKEMAMPQTIIRLEGQMAMLYPDARFLNYGLGWFLSDFRGRKLVEHGGAIDGMRGLVAMLPEEKLGVVILTNMNGSILSIPLAYRIFDAYLGAAPRDWSAEMLKTMTMVEGQARAMAAKQEAERVAGTKPSLALEKYAGDYQNEMYGDAKVVFDNGKLALSRGPNFTGSLEHWHYDVFRVTWSDRQMGRGLVSFRLDHRGRVAEMNMENLAEFTRVPEKAEKK
jgi:CubicO group peptidase (beta-lactamase class C family)